METRTKLWTCPQCGSQWKVPGHAAPRECPNCRAAETPAWDPEPEGRSRLPPASESDAYFGWQVFGVLLIALGVIACAAGLAPFSAALESAGLGSIVYLLGSAANLLHRLLQRAEQDHARRSRRPREEPDEALPEP